MYTTLASRTPETDWRPLLAEALERRQRSWGGRHPATAMPSVSQAYRWLQGREPIGGRGWHGGLDGGTGMLVNRKWRPW